MKAADAAPGTAPPAPSTQRRAFHTQGEFPPSDPLAKAEVSYLRSALPPIRGLPREAPPAQTEQEVVVAKRKPPTGTAPSAVLREPPRRRLRPGAEEKRRPGLSAARTSRARRRRRLASRRQRSLELPAPLTTRRRAGRAPRMPSSLLGRERAPARRHAPAAPSERASEIRSPGLACSRASELSGRPPQR